MICSLAFGGGVNSTALLVGLAERDELPTLATFAGTGGELPETYKHVAAVREWCLERGVEFVTVNNGAREDAPHATLEQECITNGTLPSLAFGNKGCSAKWKRQPQARYLASREDVQASWAAGQPVTVLLGIDAGEAHRSANLAENSRWRYARPLVEWGWDREDCIAAIERSSLEVPSKSACWFCPAAKKREVLALAKERPELFARAVAMEQNARERGGLQVVRGLGRHWSWEGLERADRAQLRLFTETVEMACGCFDGGDA